MSYPTENLTTRVYELHADLVRRAAAKAEKTVSDYVRDIVVQWAASDLGERLPPLPDLKRGRYRELVEGAAKRAGMTVTAFERHAAETLAAQAMGVPSPDDARAPGRPPTIPPPSGERPRVDLGGYAVTGARTEVIRRRKTG